jgi:hypothetical protein
LSAGIPLPPRNLHLDTSGGTILVWDRPANIHEEISINYTLKVYGTPFRQFTIENRTYLSDAFLERKLAVAGECEAFKFHIQANVPDIKVWSEATTLNETLPHREWLQTLIN